MTKAAPHAAQAVTLTGEEGRRLWNWTLYRQGLHPAHRQDTAAEIADASLGIHAARLPTPYTTILARSTDPRTALTVLNAQHDLTTLRCMRKTLHLLPLDLAAAAHAATAHYRTRDAARLAVNAGVPPAAVTRLARALLDLLADGPLAQRHIESQLITARHTATAVRVALKIAWERGDLTNFNQSGCWNQERRAFGLTTAVRPGLNTAMEAGPATRQLIGAYFDRYGPATIKDAMWWSALSRSAITAAMRGPDQAWIEVTTPWAPNPAYMPESRYQQFLDADSSTYKTGLNLLAHEDVALKAYFETRDRYLNGLAPRKAFNQIGEVLPTIVIDGTVHGTWAWNSASRKVTTVLVPSRARGLGRRLDAHAGLITDALRAGWRERPTNTVHAPEGQLALVL